MAQPENLQLTELINRAKEPAYLERLLEEIYPNLHRLARGQLQGESQRDLLNATELVNESFLSGLRQVLENPDSEFENRKRFFAYAARVMRNVRAKHARERLVSEVLNADLEVVTASDEGQIIVDDLLNQIRKRYPRQVEAVELRVAGHTIEEIAQLTGWSPATIKLDIGLVRAEMVSLIRSGETTPEF